MSPFAWIGCLLGFTFLFWLVARKNGGNARQRMDAQMTRDNSELRQVVMEMSKERHLMHTGTHHDKDSREHGRR
jgi:hypothetical protein